MRQPQQQLQQSSKAGKKLIKEEKVTHLKLSLNLITVIQVTVAQMVTIKVILVMDFFRE